MTPDTHGQPPRQAAPRSLSEGTYEFDSDENVRIGRAATSSVIWAVCAIVGAVLLATLAGLQVYLNNLRGAILLLPLFLVCAVAGWLYLGAGRSLKQVVTTEGNDVELLMRALQRMATAFRNEVIVMVVAFVIFAALAVLTRM